MLSGFTGFGGIHLLLDLLFEDFGRKQHECPDMALGVNLH